MDPLELETRRRLYEHVRRHPGKYLRELQRDLGMAMGALEYHLNYLETAGLVTSLSVENKRFFPSSMDRRDKRLMAVLRQRLPRRVLVILLREGTASKSGLLSELRVATSTLNYHLSRLVGAGLVVAEREGRDAVYRVPDPEGMVRLLVANRYTFFDRMVDAFVEDLGAFGPKR